MERTHQVEVIAQAEYDPCNDCSLLLEPVHAHDGSRQIDHAKPETHAYCNGLADRLHPLWHTRRTEGKTLAASDLVSPQPARTG